MTGISLAALADDLAEETTVVDDLLLSVSASEWELPTPAAGWTIRDQVSHLAFFDEMAVLAALTPDRFRREAKELIALGPEFPDRVAERYRTMPVPELRDWFHSARADLLLVMGELDGSHRVPWFGPDMSLTSSATARLMETWAHGLDIADTLGADCAPTDRLRHIAHLGVRTLGFSFGLRDLPVPVEPVHVELAAPGGGTWEWGPAEAANAVSGPALDFCLIVTQRRHLSETDLLVRGQVAQEWMSVAQAFAGAPGPGRPPVRTVVKEVS
jgi:uncharacterized protein (TIGR03084 family)